MAKELHLQFYDQIGSDFWSGEGTTAKNIAALLAANADSAEIILHINSPGGSVYEGYTIYNLLKASGKKITAKIEGYCASIATLIALSAEEIEMLPLAQWLIHNPFTSIEGDAADLEQAAAELKRIESVLVGIYQTRTGKTEEEIRALMMQDRFINATEAVEMGFATRVLEPLKAVAFYKSNNSTKPEPEMSTEKEPSLWAKVKATVAELAAALNEGEPDTTPPAPVASSETLENDSLIYFEGELEAGKMVFTDPEMTLSAADGEYTLKDGRVISVEAGAVKAITAAAPENSAELEAAKATIAELETKLAEVTATASAKDTTITNLKAQLKIVPGGTGGKAGTPPQNHAADTPAPAAELVPFNAAAEKLKAKYNRK